MIPDCAVLQKCCVDIQPQTYKSNESQHVGPDITGFVVDFENAPETLSLR